MLDVDLEVVEVIKAWGGWYIFGTSGQGDVVVGWFRSENVYL